MLEPTSQNNNNRPAAGGASPPISPRQFDWNQWIHDTFGSGKFAKIYADAELFSWLHDHPKSSADIQSKVSPIINRLIPQLAELLALKLDVLSSNGPHEFKATVQMDIDDLLKGSNAGEMLKFVGFIYENEAKEHDGVISGLKAHLESRSHKVSREYEMAQAGSEMQSTHEKLKKGDGNRDALQANLFRLTAQTYKNLCKQQIEELLRRVCEAVLSGKNIDGKHRKRRLKALKDLGEAYSNAGSLTIPSGAGGESQRLL